MEAGDGGHSPDLRSRIREVAFRGSVLANEKRCLPRFTKFRRGAAHSDFVLPSAIFRDACDHGVTKEVSGGILLRQDIHVLVSVVGFK